MNGAIRFNPRVNIYLGKKIFVFDFDLIQKIKMKLLKMLYGMFFIGFFFVFHKKVLGSSAAVESAEGSSATFGELGFRDWMRDGLFVHLLIFVLLKNSRWKLRV